MYFHIRRLFKFITVKAVPALAWEDMRLFIFAFPVFVFTCLVLSFCPALLFRKRRTQDREAEGAVNVSGRDQKKRQQ